MDTGGLADLTVRDFLDRLASDAPTPGGGAVAALSAALAASLGRMAGALTAGKPRFAGVERQVLDLMQRLHRTSAMLLRLMEEDAEAYALLAAAFKLRKDDAARAGRIEAAATYAAAVPLQTMAAGRRVLNDLERLGAIANPNLRSDVAAGQHLAHAAIAAAAENVRANLPYVSDEQRQAVQAELDRLLAAPAPGSRSPDR